MGTTPVFGFPYPDPSDLVANYPALGQQLAEDIEDELLLLGKILQVVRATDSTNRSTSSSSFVDVSGMSVTITPQKSDSAILLIASFRLVMLTGSSSYADVQITDASNNAISGGYMGHGSTAGDHRAPYTIIAYATPATTSAVTYKLRFIVSGGGGTLTMENGTTAGQMYAIEVGA